jgi:hypothetical protein
MAPHLSTAAARELIDMRAKRTNTRFVSNLRAAQLPVMSLRAGCAPEYERH